MQIGYNSVCIKPTKPSNPVGFADQACNLKIQQTIQDLFDQPVQVIVTCSHTHYAPSLSNFMGVFEKDRDYEQFVLIKLTNLVRNCQYKERNLTYSYHIEPFNQVGKSRLPSNNDENICASIFSFYENNNRIGNILFYNWHPTISDSKANYFSSDYPGVAIENLQHHYPKEFFLFLQGADGDVSTRYNRQEKSYGEVIRLANKLTLCYKSILQLSPRIHPITLDYAFQEVSIHPTLKRFDPMKFNPNLPDAELKEIETAKLILKMAEKSYNPSTQKAWFSRLSLGRMRLVFTPFELFSSYMDLVDREVTILVCYAYASMGYLSPPNNQECSYESLIEIPSEEYKKNIIKVLMNL